MLLFAGDERDPAAGFRYPAEVVVTTAGGMVPIRQHFAAENLSLHAVDGLVILTADDRIIAFRVANG